MKDDLIERTAEIINPHAFKNYRGMYDYCLRAGDDEAEAKRTADWAHGKEVAEATEKARYVLAIARPAILEEAAGWLPMDSAPTDGTVIHVVGRYVDATAGFPRYASFMKGGWYELTKFSPQRLVCWAWQPRVDWPSEPLSTTGERNDA